MSHSSSARWLAVFPAPVAFAAVAMLGTAAVAQPASMPAHHDSGSPKQTTAPFVALSYNSALGGYRPFADEKAIPWKEANETVYRRGGWQAYAKENAGPSAAESALPKGSNASTATQPSHSMPMPGMPGMSSAAAMKDKP